MRIWVLASLALGTVLVPFVAACDNSGGSATGSGTTTESTVSTTLSTTTAPTPPPPLTHKQFIRRLDRLCKVGNKASARRFQFEDIYDTAESMDAYAAKLAKVNRYINRSDRKHGFFKLDPAEPDDARDYERYKEMTRRLRNFSLRQVRAARRHQFEEIVRLLDLEKQTRNQRTKLTADMGLRFCGA
jgi:hypothetical protein